MIYREDGFGPAGGYLTVVLDERLDLTAVGKFRNAVEVAGDVCGVAVDLSAVRLLDATAVGLLEDDLQGLRSSGVRVVTRRAPSDDKLFTDPDLDFTGFQPSSR